MARSELPAWLVAALQEVQVYLLGRQVTGVHLEQPPELEAADLSTLIIHYPEGDLDPGQLYLLLDYEPGLGGYPLRFFRAASGVLRPESEQVQQYAGQKFLGESQLALVYGGEVLEEKIITVRYLVSQFTSQQVQFMRSELMEQNISLLDYYGMARDLQELMRQLPPGAAAARFEVLRRVVGEFLPLFRRIERDPQRALQRVAVPRPLHSAGQVSLQMLDRAAQHCGQWQWVEGPAGRSLLPARLPVEQNVVSYNTPDNRFLLQLVRQMRREAVLLRQQLAAEAVYQARRAAELRGGYREWVLEKAARARRGVQYLAGVENTLDGLVQNSFLRHLPGLTLHQNREVQTLHPLYRQARRLARRLRSGLRLADQLLAVDEAALPVRTRSINTLYEYWVAMGVVRALVELGFEPLSKNGARLAGDERSFNYNLKENGVVELKAREGRLLVWYARRYPRLDYAPAALLGAYPYRIAGVWQCKDCPDVAMEYYPPGALTPEIITLDATFSHDPRKLQEKQYYTDTIRSRSSPHQPEEEWEFPVREAWAVYPDDYYPPARRSRTTGGELGLVPGPGAAERLRRWLAERLKAVWGL
ncbi:MAG: DUF2357 domain-containing protein [Desulfurispora sp.]|uniref:DUF2357 domain-containing protein n=1 Tax=Desulfurispora sp. TaxID=3014275 RepID=UPI00404B7B6F